MKIYILTGAIRTGKTTSLMEWIKDRDNVYGILTPVINEIRYFVDAEKKEQFRMEAEKEEENVLNIGRFNFSEASFNHASEIMRRSLSKSGWIIVDEIGPLELTQKGFYKIVEEIISKQNKNMNAVFVIRDSIFDKAINFFKLNDYEIFNFPK